MYCNATHSTRPNQNFKSFVSTENPQVTEPAVFWKDAKSFVTEAESWPRRTMSTRPGRRQKMTARPEFLNTYRHIEATRPASNSNNDLGEHLLSSWLMHSFCNLHTHVRSGFHRAQCRCEEFLLEHSSRPAGEVSGVSDTDGSSSCLFLTSMEWNIMSVKIYIFQIFWPFLLTD